MAEKRGVRLSPRIIGGYGETYQVRKKPQRADSRTIFAFSKTKRSQRLVKTFQCHCMDWNSRFSFHVRLAGLEETKNE
jgi:hypothetical protein